jgi:hypothetical protein
MDSLQLSLNRCGLGDDGDFMVDQLVDPGFAESYDK